MSVTAKKPTKEQLISAYKDADTKGKAMLESLHGKEIFATKEKPKSKEATTFAEVCAALKVKASAYAIPAKGSWKLKADIAMSRLKLIAKHFNGDWVADIADTSQYKYWCWFDVIKDSDKVSGFGFAYAFYDYDFANTDVGSRPNFKSSEICMYVGKTFLLEFEQFQQFQQMADREI